MNVSPAMLAALRKERGWSQGKLAAISGVSERTIQRTEKDGPCSMDTKLAFATALEVSPAELSCPTKASQPGDPSQYVIAWSGAFGLFILGLAMAAVVLLTGTNGTWEIASLSIVWDLTAVFSMIRHGAKQTYRLYNHTSWVVKYPKHAEGLNRLIVHANAGINNSYIFGVSASLITGVSLPFIPICLPKIWGAISLSPPNQQFTPSFSQSYGFDPTSIEWKACCNAKVKDDEDLRTGPVSLADEGSPTPPPRPSPAGIRLGNVAVGQFSGNPDLLVLQRPDLCRRWRY